MYYGLNCREVWYISVGDILFHHNCYRSVGLLACHITGTAEKESMSMNINETKNPIFGQWFWAIVFLDRSKPLKTYTISIWLDDEGWSSICQAFWLILISTRLQAATTVLIHRRMPYLFEAQQPLLSKIAEVDQWVGDRSDRHWAKYVSSCCFTGQPRPINDTLQRRHSKSEIWLSPHATEFVKRSWKVHSFSGSEMDLDHES